MKALLLALVLSCSVAMAGERPTPKQVLEAVAVSRAAENPEQRIKDLTKELASLRRERGVALKGGSTAERQAVMAKLNPPIKELEEKLKTTKLEIKRQSPDERFILPVKNIPAEELKGLEDLMLKEPLSRFDWNKMSVGQVGWIGPQVWGGAYTGQFRCEQRLGDGRWLGRQVLQGASAIAGVRGRTSQRPLVLVSGISKDCTGNTIQDGGTYQLYFNAIVTEEFTYSTAGGASKTVFVLESFDPDEPFK